jgi:hypothetical protein
MPDTAIGAIDIANEALAISMLELPERKVLNLPGLLNICAGFSGQTVLKSVIFFYLSVKLFVFSLDFCWNMKPFHRCFDTILWIGLCLM